MKSRFLGILVASFVCLAAVCAGAYIWLQNYEHSQLDHQYQLVLRAVDKAHSLDLDEEISAELEMFYRTSPQRSEDVMNLGIRIRSLVDNALDEKYKDRGSVYTDELRDREY